LAKRAGFIIDVQLSLISIKALLARAPKLDPTRMSRAQGE
jgi:hypothetical protein